MKLSLTVGPAIRHRACAFNPILGLSSLELVLLLENSTKDMDQFHEENPSSEGSGNYYCTKSFYERSKSYKGSASREMLLAHPEMIVQHDGHTYSVRHNSYLEELVARRLMEFKREEGAPPVAIFSREVQRERKWIIDQQKAIVGYLCGAQEKYLQTGNPFDLVPVNQQQVADAINSTNQRVSGLVRNLTMQLPDGRVIFADELIPGAKLYNRQGTHVLRELQKDPVLYEDGRWNVSDRELVPLLASRGLVVKSDTVRKYRSMMN